MMPQQSSLESSWPISGRLRPVQSITLAFVKPDNEPLTPVSCDMVITNNHGGKIADYGGTCTTYCPDNLYMYSKTCVKRPLSKRQEIGFKTNDRFMQIKVLQNAPRRSIL